MELLAEVTGALALLGVVAATVVIGYRKVRSRQERARAGIELPYSDQELFRRHGWDRRRQVDPPKVALHHYQYLAQGKIDRLYDQIVMPGLRPTTTTHQFGSAPIAQVSESAGPRAELTTIQKLEALKPHLSPEDIGTYSPSETTAGSAVLVRGSMLMKHAILPVYWSDETATQAVWLGRLDTGRLVCLGGSAANIGAEVPRGQYLNSGVTGVLQAIETASDQIDVRFQPDVRLLTASSGEPLHAFPGAWDAEVVDVWLHFGKLHTHRVEFLAYLMTSSRVDIPHSRYDVVVGSPISVEFV